MTVAAFALVACMLTVYVMLDGYDLGIATSLSAVARNERERAAAIRAIGPFWNGNEVWLIATGAVLFALFPKAYASAFSGFYLPFIVVLWLLMFRGIAMELRGHFDSVLWREFWDAAFSASSALLLALFGIALGNLLRGLPLDAHGYFMGTLAYLLNGYALLVGIFAVLVLVQHGLAFLSLRVDGAFSQRVRGLASHLWWVSAGGYVAVTAATFAVRGSTLALSPVAPVALLSIVALLLLRRWILRERDVAAFLASCAFVSTLLAEAAATIFPYLLPARPLGHGGLSIYDAQPNPIALVTAFVTTIAGLTVVVAYSAFVARRMMERIRVDD